MQSKLCGKTKNRSRRILFLIWIFYNIFVSAFYFTFFTIFTSFKTMELTKEKKTFSTKVIEPLMILINIIMKKKKIFRNGKMSESEIILIFCSQKTFFNCNKISFVRGIVVWQETLRGVV